MTDMEQPTTTEPATPTPTATATEVAAAPAAAAAPAEGGGDDSMAQMEAYEDSFKELKPGQFLSGRVVRVDAEGVLVDVGYKSEGHIPISELSHRKDAGPEELVKVGDQIDVVVLKVEGAEGSLRLSKRRADLEAAWIKVLRAHEHGEIITATCTEQVKGGLIVDLGLRGFIPASHVDMRPVHDLSDYVGESLELKVLEVDQARRKVVLLRKKALEEERSKMKDKTMGQIEEGQILSGTVARLTNFGAFINLGGVDGLVHLSELAWKRIKHPNEVVKVGDKVEVRVLSVNPEKERISLSLKQARPDPWTVAAESLAVNQIIPGRVSKLAKNYLFVEIADGVEGLVPVSELTDQRVQRPLDQFKVDQEVKVKVLEVRPESRRILLSIKQGSDDYQPRHESVVSSKGGDGSSGFTIGDRIPDHLKHLLAGGEESNA
jgi:4-hydroxy-3-methylbut-2-enyl diphosphate reductase